VLDLLGEFSFLKEKPKKWLVTGCAGFIGSNLVEALLLLDQKVVGLDNFSTGKKENLDLIKKAVGEKYNSFEFLEGDIRDYEKCLDATKGVDYVLHQAAIGSVPRSIQNPLFTHENNINGQLNVLTAAKENKVPRLVFASSSSVYGDHPALPKVESEIGNCLSPYAVTKRVNELYAEVFQKNYGIETVGLRYFNVFGQRQDPDSVYAAVIPKWVKAMMRNEEVAIFGDGETSRDFCHVDNAIKMNILAAISENKESAGKAYNCACGERTSLNQLYKYLQELMVSKYEHLRESQVVYGDFRPGDVRHSLADYSLAKNNLKYEYIYDVRQGLERTIQWYLENLS
jgi:UDP-N-acetylglucosamine/UDP-N-acetylgalactosamine 4-epimerase